MSRAEMLWTSDEQRHCTSHDVLTPTTRLIPCYRNMLTVNQILVHPSSLLPFDSSARGKGLLTRCHGHVFVGLPEPPRRLPYMMTIYRFPLARGNNPGIDVHMFLIL